MSMITTRTSGSIGLTDPAHVLRACRIGDPSAWDVLVQRYERLVYAIGIREGLCPDDAADVAQATFEAFLDALDGLPDETSIGAWLACVARRQAWRTRQRRRREHHVEHLDDLPDDHELDAELALLDDRCLGLYECVAGLEEPCRSLIFALYFDPDRPSYAQVAATTGRPIGSIGPTRARCLQRLRQVVSFERITA